MDWINWSSNGLESLESPHLLMTFRMNISGFFPRITIIGCSSLCSFQWYMSCLMDPHGLQDIPFVRLKPLLVVKMPKRWWCGNLLLATFLWIKWYYHWKLNRILLWKMLPYVRDQDLNLNLSASQHNLKKEILVPKIWIVKI